MTKQMTASVVPQNWLVPCSCPFLELLVMSHYQEENKDLSWKKPEWTKNLKLRSTGKADVVKQGGNLAAPITDLPHQKNTPLSFSKPEWTDEASAKEGQRVEGDLAKPITSLPHSAGAEGKDLSFQKPDWTKKAVLHASSKGAALKEGKEISRPIGGIKPVDES